jgi:hypothetical protein
VHPWKILRIGAEMHFGGVELSLRTVVLKVSIKKQLCCAKMSEEVGYSGRRPTSRKLVGSSHFWRQVQGLSRSICVTTST